LIGRDTIFINRLLLMKYFRLGHIPEGGMSATFSQGTSGLLPPLLAEIFLFGESNQRKDPDI
jgi:hypothetical protein